MRFYPMAMAGDIVITESPINLDHQSLLDALDLQGCGAVVSFLGITRGYDDGVKIHRLEFDAWRQTRQCIAQFSE